MYVMYVMNVMYVCMYVFTYLHVSCFFCTELNVRDALLQALASINMTLSKECYGLTQ